MKNLFIIIISCILFSSCIYSIPLIRIKNKPIITFEDSAKIIKQKYFYLSIINLDIGQCSHISDYIHDTIVYERIQKDQIHVIPDGRGIGILMTKKYNKGELLSKTKLIRYGLSKKENTLVDKKISWEDGKRKVERHYYLKK